MSERYNKPEKGTLDWNNPLNENFAKLERDVEYRDTDTNRSNYEPKAGAKFLATDTGTVYIGDGSQWNTIGTIGSGGGDSTTTSGEMADGTLVAEPGSIQETIDAASSQGTYSQSPAQRVVLKSGRTYRIDSTIKVRKNVILDCNGARFEPAADVDLFHLYRGTRLVDPFIDCRPNSSWSSRAIVIGPNDAGKLGANNRAWVDRAYMSGNKGEGSGDAIVFHGGDQPCSGQYASGYVRGFENGVHFHAEGADTSGRGDWSNANQFTGMVSHSVYLLRLQSEGAAVSGNMAKAQLQPKADTTKWAVYIDDDPNPSGGGYKRRGNSFQVYPWDWNGVTNEYKSGSDRRAPAYYVGTGKAYQNVVIDRAGKTGNDFMVNNSDTRAKENGVTALHGWDVRGATQFTTQPAFQRNSERNYHPESSY